MVRLLPNNACTRPRDSRSIMQDLAVITLRARRVMPSVRLLIDK